MAGVSDAYWVGKKKKIKFIAGCFFPQQPILTSAGVKEICKVKSGDLVLTHLGRWKKVKNIQVQKYNGKVSSVEAWGSAPQVATSNHKFLIKHGTIRDQYKVNWTPLGDVKRITYNRTYASKRGKNSNLKERWGNYFCIPKTEDINIENIDVITLLNNYNGNYFVNENHQICCDYKDKFNTIKIWNFPATIDLDNKLLWIIGLFLAEGSYSKSPGGYYNSLEFSLGGTEIKYALKIKKYFSKFNIHVGIRDRKPQRNAIDVTVYSSLFARIFKFLFGEHAKNKALPYNWINLSKSKLKPLIVGLFDGDGKWKNDQSTLKLTSRTLIWQARLILAKLGTISAISTHETKCDKHSTSYSIRWRMAGHTYCDQDNLYHYLPIKRTTSIEIGPTIVYNLEVEDDHSYFIGVAVKNCEVYFNENHLELVELQKDKDWKIGSLKTSKTTTEIDIEQIEREEKYDSLRRNRHLTVLAMNMVGYRNLIHMTSRAWETGMYYKPRVWFDRIKEYQEGLIILSGCLNGPVCHALRQAAKYLNIAAGKYKKDRFNRTITISKEDAIRKKDQWLAEAEMWIVKFRDLMGDRFYLELQMPGKEIPFGKEAFTLIAMLSKKYDVSAIISNDCHFTNRQDFKVQKCMMAVEQGLTINDPNLFHVDSDEQFYKSRAQLRQTFYEGGYDVDFPIDFEECLGNTVRLAERCESFNPDIEPKLPKIPEANKKLFKLVMEALKEKGLLNSTKKYKVDGQMVTHRQQAIIELRRYIEKEFASYFLIIRDLVNHSKTNGWDIGPGRGSAGGSLVCYLLGIHSLDPLKWGLSSVRFMGDSRGGHMLNVTME